MARPTVLEILLLDPKRGATTSLALATLERRWLFELATKATGELHVLGLDRDPLRMDRAWRAARQERVSVLAPSETAREATNRG